MQPGSTLQPALFLNYIGAHTADQRSSSYKHLAELVMGAGAAPADTSHLQCHSMLGAWESQPHSSVRATISAGGESQQTETTYSAHSLQIVWQQGCVFAGYNSWLRSDGSLSATEMVSGVLTGDHFVMLEFSEGDSSFVGFIEGEFGPAGEMHFRFTGALPGSSLAFATVFTRRTG